MKPFVALAWPKDTEGQLREFRANVLGIFFTSILALGMVVAILHHNPSGSLLLSVLGLGSISAFTFTSVQPITPFRERLFLPRAFSELDESARRVLAFLRSAKARAISLVVSLIFSLFVASVALIDWFILQRFTSVSMNWDMWEVSGIIITTMFYALFLSCANLAVIHLWIARHFELIMRTYQPLSE